MNNLESKKKYVAAGGTVAIGLPVSFLILFFVNMQKTVVATEACARENRTDIQKVEQLPERFAVVEQQVKDLKEDFVDQRDEQRKWNDRTENKLDKILSAVIP